MKTELESLGFYDKTNDELYNKFLLEISKNELFQKVEFTDEERTLLEEESKNVIEQILKDTK